MHNPNDKYFIAIDKCAALRQELIKILNEATSNNYGDLVASGDKDAVPRIITDEWDMLEGFTLRIMSAGEALRNLPTC